MTVATILIPAHNEATVIGRTLLHMSRGLCRKAFRILLIANGCSDATTAKARSVLPDLEIIETTEAGKCNALNLGFERADKTAPLVCVDADLDVTAESLTALVATLNRTGAMAACGKMDVRTDQATSIVRSYYRGWRTNPYFDQGKFGGLFALSAQAAMRIFPLPKITADDEYIRRSFSHDERVFVKGCSFTARAPQTLASLMNVRRRSLRGAQEVSSLGLAKPERNNGFRVMYRAANTPSAVLPVIVFSLVNLCVRLALALPFRSAPDGWERDCTTRTAG